MKYIGLTCWPDKIPSEAGENIGERVTLEREATQLFNVATCDVVSVGLRRRAGQLEVVVRLDHCSLLGPLQSAI